MVLHRFLCKVKHPRKWVDDREKSERLGYFEKGFVLEHNSRQRASALLQSFVKQADQTETKTQKNTEVNNRNYPWNILSLGLGISIGKSLITEDGPQSVEDGNVELIPDINGLVSVRLKLFAELTGLLG